MSVTTASAPTREDFTALLNETYGENEAFEGAVVKAGSSRSKKTWRSSTSA